MSCRRLFFLIHRRQRRKAILLFAFLCRLYYLDDNHFAAVRESLLWTAGKTLEELHEHFYAAYQRGFCTGPKENITINVHTFSHLHQVREAVGPLHSNSAEEFEAAYAVLRRCYRAGTWNIPKQIFQNFYLRDKYVTAQSPRNSLCNNFFPLNRHTHYCRHKQKVVVQPRSSNTSKVSNSLVVTDAGLFSVFEKTDHGYKANAVQSREFDTESVLGYFLPWSQVGVTRYVKC